LERAKISEIFWNSRGDLFEESGGARSGILGLKGTGKRERLSVIF